MSGIWTSKGCNQLLDVYAKGSAAPDLYLGLFNNNGSPPQVYHDLTTYTEPANGSYARINIPAANWTLTANMGQLTAEAQTFTPSGANWGAIDGWFLTDAANGTSGVLIAAEQFLDGPYSGLDTVPITVIAALNAS